MYRFYKSYILSEEPSALIYILQHKMIQYNKVSKSHQTQNQNEIENQVQSRGQEMLSNNNQWSLKRIENVQRKNSEFS